MAVLEETEDNRSAPRLETRAVLTFFPFSSRKVPAFTARVSNCSPGGVSFRSGRPLKPGQTICLIRESTPAENRTGHRAAAMLRSFALAEVRWCREDPHGKEGYRVGVKYL